METSRNVGWKRPMSSATMRSTAPEMPTLKIVPRCQRLGLGDDAALLRPEDRVGIGTAGIDPEEDRTFSCGLSS